MTLISAIRSCLLGVLFIALSSCASAPAQEAGDTLRFPANASSYLPKFLRSYESFSDEELALEVINTGANRISCRDGLPTELSGRKGQYTVRSTFEFDAERKFKYSIAEVNGVKICMFRVLAGKIVAEILDSRVQSCSFSPKMDLFQACCSREARCSSAVNGR